MFELLAQGFEGLPTSRHYATNTLILHLPFLESNAVAPAKGSITVGMIILLLFSTGWKVYQIHIVL